MKRNNKRRRRGNGGHFYPTKAGLVRTVIYALYPADRDVLRRPVWEGIGGLMGRLTGGRVSRRAWQFWMTGEKRAPAWFIAVLRSEIEGRRDKLNAALALLDQYKPQDRERTKAHKAALARAQMLAGIGAIGQRRHAQEASARRETALPGESDPHK